MKLIQIDYFLTVAEEKNFSSAAKKLFVSQPALSKQIKILEEEIGTPLFNRTSTGVFLTEAGAKLEEDLKRIKEEINMAKISAAALGQVENQTIQIGCFDGLYVDDFLPSLIEFFKKTKSKAKVKISRKNNEKNIMDLLNNKIDILCSLDEDLISDDRICHKILNKRKAAIIYSDKLFESNYEPKSIGDFLQYTFFTPPKYINTKTENLLNEKFNIKILQESVENIQTVQTNIGLGLGYAILAEGLSNQIQGVKSFPLPEEFDVNIYGIWRADHPFMSDIMSKYPGCDILIRNNYKNRI